MFIEVHHNSTRYPAPTFEGWYRVADIDGSTVAFTPDKETAQAICVALDKTKYYIRTRKGRGRVRDVPFTPDYTSLKQGIQEAKQ